MRALFVISVLLFAGFPLFSQQEDDPTQKEIAALYEDLFSTEEALDLILKFDVEALKKTRHQDLYHEAVLNLVASENLQHNYAVEVRAGGNMRREFCALPPIYLNLGNAVISGDSPQGGYLIPMVVPCKKAAKYKPYVFREYLAYKLYNIITPLSYRVRLVRLTLIDTGKDNKVTEDWAFIQEPDALMASRLNAKLITSNELSMNSLNPEVLNSLSMFQYMIGNADYSVTGRYNLNILAMDSGNPPGFLPVPYDFDYSGLVNAHYAVPGESLGTNSVQERYYLGPCRPEMVHDATIQELAVFEDEIKACVEEFNYLDDGEKADMIEYLNAYFKESRESMFIDRKIVSTCR